MYSADAYHGQFLTSSHPETSQNRPSVGPNRPSLANKTVSKPNSSDALADMSEQQLDPIPHIQKPRNGSEESLSTIPDPRNASSSDLSRSPSPRHPDLSDEVAKLSDKLIHAINHQTALEDTLAQACHEVDTARIRIQELEVEAVAHEDKVSSGLLVPKSDVEREQSQLVADLASERKQKLVILQEKRSIEGELETLTVSLFEEANKMVAAANKDRDAVERRNQQLRDQITETESLLAKQQEQLTQLKIVMQQMEDESAKDEGPEPARISTEPSSPSSYREKDANVLRLLEAMNLSPRSVEMGGEISPAPSTTFTHLLKPVCRIDLPAYEDFRQLLLVSQKSRPASRVTSGSYAGVSVMGMSALASSSQSASQPAANSSSTSLKTPSNQSLTTSPQLPGSFSPNPNPDKGPAPLKEMKFYKRLVVEDIEPTLRLDLSPTISWLSRRNVLSGLAENGLIVEPIPDQGLRLYGRVTPCALCGESRKDKTNPRTHRMRVSEEDGATKWALCVLCLEKVRATCDLVGYVRMIRDGVVRCADKDEEQEAWEELVRLRERLFWARMAGGVVPSFVERMSEKLVENVAVVGAPPRETEPSQGEEAVFQDAQTHHPISSTSHRDQTPPNTANAANPSTLPTSTTTTTTAQPSPDPESLEAAAQQQLHRDLSDSIPARRGSDDPTASMPGIRDVTPKTPPRFPVREKRGGSWGHLKVSVPKAFLGSATT